MPEYTVQTALKTKDVEGQYGAMKVVALQLQEYGAEPVAAEWFTKAATPLPEPGSKLEGTIEQSQYGLRFKKTQAGGFTAGPRGRSPEETRSIVRQHSQHMALLYCQVRATQGKLPEDFGMSELRTLVNWFDLDVSQASKQAPS